jgi:hypothetical protein
VAKKRERNYQEEYRARIQRGIARGYSRQQARGRHPGEGVRMPDGRIHTRISVREKEQKFLRADSLEDLHRVNAGLRGRDKDKWEKFVQRMGWTLFESSKGHSYTQNDVPSEILEAMSHSERRYFFGY